jgi:hypothetical protein
VRAVAGESVAVPLVTWKPTVTPGTGAPLADVTRTVSGDDNGVPAAPVWPLPLNAATEAGVGGVPPLEPVPPVFGDVASPPPPHAASQITTAPSHPRRARHPSRAILIPCCQKRVVTSTDLPL